MLFFFNDTATTEIYTLSLHDALPIYPVAPPGLPDVADHLPLVVCLPELEFYVREPLAQPLLYIFKCQNAIDLWPACPQCAQIHAIEDEHSSQRPPPRSLVLVADYRTQDLRGKQDR